MSTKLFRILLASALLALSAMIPCNAFAEGVADDIPTSEPPPAEKENPETKYKAKLLEKQDFEERLMEAIPYAEELRPVWHFIDGDTDIFIPNLRVDRRNKGLVYKTSEIPFVGKMEGIEFKLKAGEEMELGFESNHIPFMGELEGFNIKGSVGEESKIFARYTIKFD